MTRQSMVPPTPTRPAPPAVMPTLRRPARTARVLAAASAAISVAVLGLAVGPAAAQAEVQLEKSTNGADADAAPGPTVEPGVGVSWTWTVTASGATTLYDLVVTDTSGVTPSCDIDGDGQPDGTNIHPGPLDPGQSFQCSASGAADHEHSAGVYAATGTVRATDFSAVAAYESQDPSHHSIAAPIDPEPEPEPGFDPEPDITIRARIDGEVADGPDGPLVGEGQPITWTYVVTNTGNVPLTGVEVSDDRGRSVDCGNGTAVVGGSLAPGATASCRVNADAAAQADGPQSATGSVVAAAVDPTTGGAIGALQASDAITYVPVQLPGQLAFTGPTDLVIPLGLTLTGLGAALLVLANRATRIPSPATTGSARTELETAAAD